MKSIRRAGIIIINSKNQLLLVKGKHSKKWGYPKGVCEDNEDSRTCAMRETREEVGLKIQLPPNASCISVIGTKLYIVFRDIQNCKIDLNEIDSVGLFTIDEIYKFNKFQTTASLKQSIPRLRRYMYSTINLLKEHDKK